MIRYPVAESVVLLARQLADKGLALKPIPGSSLDAILNSTSIATTPENCDKEDVAHAIELITDVADDVADGAHRKAVGKVVDQLIPEGQEVIRKCKTEIYPLVEDLYQRAVDIVNTRRQEGVRQYAVVGYRPAEIMFSEWLVEIMEASAYRHNAWSFNRELKTIKVFPQRTIEELMILCRTDHPAVNNLVDEAIGKYGEQCIQDAYDIFFSSAVSDRRIPLNPMDLRSDGAFDGERLFGVLLAKGMMKDPPSVNMPLDSLNNYLTDVMHFCASSLHRYVGNYGVQAEKNYLNLRRTSVSSSLTQFLVNDQAYEFWKKQGLTDEAIKGAMLTDGVKDAGKILELKEKYESEWKRQEKVIGRTIESNTVAAIQKALIEVVLGHGRKIYGDNYLPKVRTMEEGVKVILEKVNPTSDKDLYVLVKEAVLCLFYPEKSFRAFINSMDEIMKESPSIDARQAAGLAFIDMAVSWLLSQCTVEKVRH